MQQARAFECGWLGWQFTMFVRASEIILNGVRKKRSRIFVGLDAKLLDLSQRLFPIHYEKTWPFIFLPMFARNQMLKKPLPDLPEEP